MAVRQQETIAELEARFRATPAPAAIGSSSSCSTAQAGIPSRTLRSPTASGSSICRPARPSRNRPNTLWPLVDEPVANRCFGALADLDAVLAERCRTLRQHRSLIAANTNFHWWPKAGRPK